MEPREIAARLHDGPVQALTAAHLLMAALEQRLGDDSDARALLSRAQRAVERASSQCRDLLHELSEDDAAGP